jgi:hypothetical protein
MLRTPKNYEFDKIENELSELEYQIDVNDQLTFQLYTNNGFQLIDMFSATDNIGIQTQRMMQEWVRRGWRMRSLFSSNR